MRDRPVLNLLLVLLAAVPLVGTIVDFVLAQGNQGLQAEIDKRQQSASQAARLVQINQLMVREIALTAVRLHDGKLSDLLAKNGITVHLAPGEPGRGD